VDEIVISRAITESYMKELLEFMEVDVAVVGAGPSGLVASYYLARKGIKTAIYERRLSIGGGIWGGGIMFNRVVVEADAKAILDEFGMLAYVCIFTRHGLYGHCRSKELFLEISIKFL